MVQKLEHSTHIYYTPKVPIQYKGCPCALTPTCQNSTSLAGKHRELIYKFVTMRLVHQTKQGKIKNVLSLKKLHLELELESLKLQGSGSSNILLEKVSFDCLILEKTRSRQTRDYLSFDLRIPQANTEEQPVFSYEMMENIYDGKQSLYEALKHFYTLGRSCANVENHKHGHEPSYDPSSSKHDQYIRHTEQLLIAYVSSSEGAKMLCNRLRTELRAKYPNASSAKVYNMVLHMHSTKTCCAPCEYALIGMMNHRTHHHHNVQKLGFIPNFIQACSVPNERLPFLFPKRSLFQLLVTVSASSPNADHRKKIEYTRQALKDRESIPNYDISVKDPIATKRVFTAMLDNGYDASRIAKHTSNLTDKTVGISGSNSTRGSPGTMKRVKPIKRSELDQITKDLHFLTLEE